MLFGRINERKIVHKVNNLFLIKAVLLKLNKLNKMCKILVAIRELLSTPHISGALC